MTTQGVHPLRNLADILNAIDADYDRVNRDFTIALAFADPRPADDDLEQIPVLRNAVYDHVTGPWRPTASTIQQLDDVLPSVLTAYRTAVERFGWRETLYNFAKLVQFGHIQTYESPWDVPQFEADMISAALLDRRRYASDHESEIAFG